MRAFRQRMVTYPLTRWNPVMFSPLRYAKRAMGFTLGKKPKMIISAKLALECNYGGRHRNIR